MKIPIVFATNDNFVSLCSVSISSIIANSSSNYKYYIYIFYTRLSKENIKKLENMTINNVIVKCLNVKSYIAFFKLYEVDNYPYEIYYRYYAPLILKYKKIIYLDCDIIVLDDIAKLYFEDIGNKTIGACIDFIYYYKQNYIFNSGVILFDCKKFEENKIREKCIDLIEKNNFKYPDQDALNIVCKDDIFLLSVKYNYQISLSFSYKFKQNISKFKNDFLDKPIIIHFSYNTKPYKNISSYYNKYFWKYAKNTPYFDELINKYIDDPYEKLICSPIQDVYIDLIKDGKIGMKSIIKNFFIQIKSWLNYKIKGGKQ